jgi:hypothetical protein
LVLDVLINIFANSPPAILIALGFVLIFFGSTTSNGELTNGGWTFVAVGVLLQIGWLLFAMKRS